jgi:hypothetical protein
MKDVVERINVEQGAITRHMGWGDWGGGKWWMLWMSEMNIIIVQQNIESLIQTTLSSNDLTLVVFTCELLNTTQVFNSAT